MHSASHPRGLMHISYVVLNFRLICTSWDFVGLSADRDNIILIIVLLEGVIPSGLKRKLTFLRSSAISFFLSFYFNFNFLILIFCLVTSFPSRKAGLIAGCTWPYSDVALGPYRLSSTVARLYHEFNSGVARLLRRQSAMFGRIPY